MFGSGHRSPKGAVRRHSVNFGRRLLFGGLVLGITLFAIGSVLALILLIRQIVPFFHGAAPVSVNRPLAAAQTAPTSSLPSYTDTHRLTILLLGIDQRANQAALHRPSRSDTMIILTIDPQQKKAALISIPRDMVVPIPGHGRQKINTAHFWGAVDHPGGGPALAVQTVELNFGIHIDYYARVDFLAFQRLINAIGGIVVDVHRPILDDAYPTPDYGIRRIYIPTGPQWMDGTRALEYARSRHSANDFARQSRQRQVILAAEKKALRPQMIAKLPQFLNIIRESVATNVPLTQLPALVNLARSIPPKNIISTGITQNMVIDVYHNGTVLLPDQVKIRHLFDTVFDTPTPASTTAAAPSVAPTHGPLKVEVLNGTARLSFAANTAALLKQKGFVITRVAQASTSTQQHTMIVDRSGNAQAGREIAAIIGVPASAVQFAQPEPNSPDVTVILGYDAPWAPR